MYSLYPSDYTTYEEVNRQLKPLTSGADLTNDKSTITRYIRQASVMISQWCYRTFVPYINTSAKVDYLISPQWVQELPDDTLVITSIADTDNTTISSESYRLRDTLNSLTGCPYRYIEFAKDVNFSYTDSNNFNPVFTVNGIFGYSHLSYENAWAVVTDTQGAIGNATTTSINVQDASGIETLDYIRIESEFMQVTGITSNTLTVRRGVNGSTAVQHNNTPDVEVWAIPETIKLSCTRLASWLYISRQTEINTVQFQDGTVAGINYPSIVQKSLFSYVKPIFETVI